MQFLATVELNHPCMLSWHPAIRTMFLRKLSFHMSLSLQGLDPNLQPTNCYLKWRISGSEGCRFEAWCQQWLSTEASPLKSTLPLVICTRNVNCEKYWFTLRARDVTWAQTTHPDNGNLKKTSAASKQSQESVDYPKNCLENLRTCQFKNLCHSMLFFSSRAKFHELCSWSIY